MKYLGEQFDIHAGGIDHIQIHHSNEIAQSEAATGLHPWVRCWFHNEFLVLDKGKMSKSLGGFITLQDLIDAGYHPLDYRYFLLGGHYRSQLQFSFESLGGARAARNSLLHALLNCVEKAGGKEALDRARAEAAGAKLSGGAAARLAEFDAALDDDLSTPKALAALWGLVKDSSIDPREALAAAFVMDEVFALDLELYLAGAAEQQTLDEARSIEIAAAIAERAEAKKAKDFARADAIRAALKAEGVILEDGAQGTVWRLSGEALKR
jgi:cysteinyl-tRNA synthetase